MTAVAQQVADMDLLRMTSCAAQGMAYDLGDGMRGELQSVRGFQIVWNSLLPDVLGVDGVHIPSQNAGQLVDDGRYGPQTATALANFSQAMPPPRADMMPVWVAQNPGEVEGMCPPAPPIDPVPAPVQSAPTVSVPMPHVPAELEPPPPSAFPPTPASAYVPPAHEGPIVDAAIPSVPPPEVVELEPVMIVEAPDPERIKAAMQVEDAPGLVPAATPLAPVRVYAKPRGGDVPVLAIGAGALVVAGVLSFWLYGKRKKK